MKKWMRGCLFWGVMLPVVGCGQKQVAEPPASRDATLAADYLLSVEPQQARGVMDVRESAQDDEAVVVVGRIGGSEDPWVEGRAAFSIVDQALQACSDKEGDNCATPWDYCCETDRLPQATLLVKVVDQSGSLVATGARELLGLKELQTVLVQGKARRDEVGNLTILAHGIFIKP